MTPLQSQSSSCSSFRFKPLKSIFLTQSGPALAVSSVPDQTERLRHTAVTLATRATVDESVFMVAQKGSVGPKWTPQVQSMYKRTLKIHLKMSLFKSVVFYFSFNKETNLYESLSIMSFSSMGPLCSVVYYIHTSASMVTSPLSLALASQSDNKR